MRTSPEALVSKAAALLSFVEPVSSADPGGISSSSGRAAREEDLLALTISVADTETTTIKINPMAHEGMSPSVDSLALLTCNFR